MDFINFYVNNYYENEDKKVDNIYVFMYNVHEIKNNEQQTKGETS